MKPMHLSRSPAPFYAVAFLVVSLMCASPAFAEDGSTTKGAGDLWLESASSALLLNGPQSPYADLAESVGPAVVNIIVTYDAENLPQGSRHSLTPRPDSLAQGSGFIIHPDGYILTNFHVIDHAASITVRLSDGKELDAVVIGVDPATDLALMRVDVDEDLPAIRLGKSVDSRPGDFVVAIGNPMGLNHSVTAGIISAVGRRDLPIEGQNQHGNFIQTDAPINPGNSGGPLINMNGEVIGINTAINRHGQGISFAIPIDMVKTLLPQLEEQGYVIRSWLGVRIQPLDPLLARSFDRDDEKGALVTEILSDSPASRAGIQEKDIILAVNSEPLKESDLLPWLVSTTPDGTRLTLQILRDGELIDLQVAVEAVPDQEPPDLPGTRPLAEGERLPLGVQVTPMTSRLARQLSAPDETGVVVTSLTESSPARTAGLRNRDVIVEVGSTAVATEQEFHDALQDFADGEIVRLKVLRRGRAVYMAFTK